jgi:hypothetical protein
VYSKKDRKLHIINSDMDISEYNLALSSLFVPSFNLSCIIKSVLENDFL